MTRPNRTQPEEHGEDRIPPALARALRDLETRRSRSLGDEAFDREILQSASLAFEQRGRRRIAGRRLVFAGGAIAAAVGLAASALLVMPQFRSARRSAPMAAVEAQRDEAPALSVAPRHGDIDGSGRIDILDAFALARLLETPSRAQGSTALDQNGDGVLDSLDVDALAAAAVSLENAG